MNITIHLLRPGGNFVAKIFRGREIEFLVNQLDIFFDSVTLAKPRSSRNSSIGKVRLVFGTDFAAHLADCFRSEGFVVCLGFRLPDGYEHPALGSCQLDVPSMSNIQRRVLPFLACGDLSGYDADQSYPLEHVSLFILSC